MSDVLVVAVVLGFFALAAAYVALCDRIVGPDPIELTEGEPEELEEVAP